MCYLVTQICDETFYKGGKKEWNTKMRIMPYYGGCRG